MYPCTLYILYLCVSSYTWQSRDKVLPGEKSIEAKDFHRTISKTSSSGSSFEKLPAMTRYGGNSTSSIELKKLDEDEVTALTEQLSVAEEEVKKLQKEKKKLERKLKEAEEVAEQAATAATEVCCMVLSCIYSTCTCTHMYTLTCRVNHCLGISIQ